MHGNAKRPAQGRAPVGASFVHCDSSDHNLELAGLEHLGTIWMGQVCQRQVAKIGKDWPRHASFLDENYL